MHPLYSNASQAYPCAFSRYCFFPDLGHDGHAARSSPSSRDPRITYDMTRSLAFRSIAIYSFRIPRFQPCALFPMIIQMYLYSYSYGLFCFQVSVRWGVFLRYEFLLLICSLDTSDLLMLYHMHSYQSYAYTRDPFHNIEGSTICCDILRYDALSRHS